MLNLIRCLHLATRSADPTRNTLSHSPALRASAGAARREFFNPRTTLAGPWLSVSSRRFSGEVQLLATSKAVGNGASSLGTVTLYDAGQAEDVDRFLEYSALSMVICETDRTVCSSPIDGLCRTNQARQQQLGPL